MALTKTNLHERLMDELNLNRHQAKDALETMIEIIKDTLESGEDIMISGFGKFCVSEKAPRKGRNPATGGAMILSKRRIVTFKVSGKLRGRIDAYEND